MVVECWCSPGRGRTLLANATQPASSGSDLGRRSVVTRVLKNPVASIAALPTYNCPTAQIRHLVKYLGKRGEQHMLAREARTWSSARSSDAGSVLDSRVKSTALYSTASPVTSLPLDDPPEKPLR